MRNISSAIIIFFLLFNIVKAQPYSLKELGSQNATFPLQINSMIYDQKGVLWVISDSRLFKFDGTKLTELRNTDKRLDQPSLLFESGTDSILISNYPKGIGLLNKNTLTFIPFSESIANITFFSSLPNKDVLIGTKKGLFYWDKKRFFSYPMLKDAQISDYSKDEKGGHYLFTSRGIYSLSGNKLTFLLNPGTPSGRILSTAGGYIYYSTTQDNKLYKWDGKTSRLLQTFGYPVTQLLQVNRKEIYVVAWDINLLQNDSIKKLVTAPYERIKEIVVDKNNDLLAIGENYAYYLEQQFYSFKKEPNMTGLLESSSNRTGSENKYFANAEGRDWVQIGKDSFDLFKKYKQLASLPVASFLDCIFLEDGSFYLSSWGPGGYYYFTDKTITFEHIDQDYGPSYFEPDKNKKGVWLRNDLCPMYIENGKHVLLNDKKRYNYLDESLRTMLTDPVNNWIWCTSSKGDIYYFDGDKNDFFLLENLNMRPAGESLSIITMFPDKKNNIWVVVKGKGMYRLLRSPKNPKMFSATLWYTNTVLGRYYFDGRGNLWCIYRKHFKIFQAGNDSVPIGPHIYRDINVWNDLEERNEGKLYFTVSNNQPKDSFSMFSDNTKYTYHFSSLSLFKHPDVKNPAVISEMKLLNDSSWEQLKFIGDNTGLPENPNLKYNQNGIRFSYSTLSSSYSVKIHYKTRLLGFDSEWQTTSTSFTDYTNLKPGRYSFQVMYTFDGFTWSAPASYTFSIISPWWQKWWFYVCLLVMLASVIYFYIRYKIARLEKQKAQLQLEVNRRTLQLENSITSLEASNKQNELLISVLVHDVKGPARFIADVSENLNDMWTSYREEDKKEIAGELKRATKALYGFLGNFLAWIKHKNESIDVKENINIRELLQQSVDYHKETGSCTNNQMIVEVTGEVIIYNFRKYLEIIISNIVDNACKNTNNGMINLSASSKGKETVITCSDTGKGISPEQIEILLTGVGNDKGCDYKGSFKMGYLFIRDLVKKTEAEIMIDSEMGRGTVVTITMKNNTRGR